VHNYAPTCATQLILLVSDLPRYPFAFALGSCVGEAMGRAGVNMLGQLTDRHTATGTRKGEPQHHLKGMIPKLAVFGKPYSIHNCYVPVPVAYVWDIYDNPRIPTGFPGDFMKSQRGLLRFPIGFTVEDGIADLFIF
jgi:hypothetical protein